MEHPNKTHTLSLLDKYDSEILDIPHFELANKVHDWRNHVPEELVSEWENLTARERNIIYFIAEQAASNEEWD